MVRSLLNAMPRLRAFLPLTFSGKVIASAVVILATLTSLLLLGCGDSSQKVLLQMKFEPGRNLVYRQVNKQTISLNNSPVVSQNSESEGEMTQKVVALSDSGYAQIKESSTWSWSESDVDTSIKVVSSTEELVYTMAPNGRISDLALPADAEASKWKEYAQSNLEQSQPTFPTELVGKGYTWMQTVKIFMPSGEKLDASTTYVLSDLVEVDGRKCAIIDYQGNLILPFDVMESDTLTRRGVDKVDVTGTLAFDYEHGYVYSQEEKTKITAERSKIQGNEAKSYTAHIEGELFFRLKNATED